MDNLNIIGIPFSDLWTYDIGAFSWTISSFIDDLPMIEQWLLNPLGYLGWL